MLAYAQPARLSGQPPDFLEPDFGHSLTGIILAFEDHLFDAKFDVTVAYRGFISEPKSDDQGMLSVDDPSVDVIETR